jgi:hypothetical protein
MIAFLTPALYADSQASSIMTSERVPAAPLCRSDGPPGALPGTPVRRMLTGGSLVPRWHRPQCLQSRRRAERDCWIKRMYYQLSPTLLKGSHQGVKLRIVMSRFLPCPARENDIQLPRRHTMDRGQMKLVGCPAHRDFGRKIYSVIPLEANERFSRNAQIASSTNPVFRAVHACLDEITPALKCERGRFR